MSFYSTRFFIIFVTSLFVWPFNFSYARQCSVHLNFGVIISPHHVRIVKQTKTHIQINDSKQLFVNGREIILTTEQEQLLEKFSQGIRQQIPEIVPIAIEGLNISLKTVNQVVASLTGENSVAQQQIQAKFDELKWRIRARFNQSTDHYYIALQDQNDFDDILTGEFEKEIEDTITDSLGTILNTVSLALISELDSSKYGSKYGSEMRVNNADTRITTISKGLNLTTSDRAKALDEKINIFCSQLKQLNNIEDTLHLSIPQIKAFNIIEISNE